MAQIQSIENGESGASARGKINSAIDAMNSMAVSGVMTAAPRNGIELNAIRAAGAVYSFWAAQNIIDTTITIEPGEAFEIASATDFPALQYYSGPPVPLDAKVHVIDLGAQTVTKIPLDIMVDGSAVNIVNLDAANDLVLNVGNIFSTHFVLVLGPQGA